MRSQEPEHGLFLCIEADISRADNTQMTRSKIVDCPAVEILVDDGRADVRRARNGRRIAEPLSDRSPHGPNYTFRLGFRLGDTVLGKSDRGNSRPAPRPEILVRAVVAHVVV